MWADVAGQIISMRQTHRNKAENYLRIYPSYFQLLVRWQYSASSLRGTAQALCKTVNRVVLQRDLFRVYKYGLLKL